MVRLTERRYMTEILLLRRKTPTETNNTNVKDVNKSNTCVLGPNSEGPFGTNDYMLSFRAGF